MGTQKGPKAHRSFHTLITVIASIIVFSGIVIGIWFLIFYNNHEETNDAQVDQYVTPVMARITGFVQEVRYEENQLVHKGDTLVVIDNREYKSHLNRALADVTNAQQNINVLEKNVATVSNTASVQESQLAAAKTEVWKTGQDYQRYKALLQEEAATEQQLEQVKAAYETAKARYDEIRKMIRTTALSTAEANSKIPTATAVVESNKALADNASLFLSYTVITAPYDGWVGKKTIQPGQMVKEGQTLVSIVSKEKWVTANFKETQVQYLEIGQEVELKADAVKGRVFRGVVESLSPASGARFSLLPPDNATGNFVKIEQRIPVRIRLMENDEQTRFLRAGMNVIVIAEHR
ncbi:HlyD family secretion protein [Flavobacterium cerinum]|uniref:HlyD family secretion protein n=1 Tax=Flavobacterium cerinum TaxID=2502784 RepID=A0ABY5IWL6_9FLAO|nr:HlyD family secretion protein [Flavobacterium cerinum]UUC45902.1 HlyD family secretion protein [Flavobacterium cerinum]